MNEFKGWAFAELERVKAVIDEEERRKKLVAPYGDMLASHLANSVPTVAQIVEQHAARGHGLPLPDAAGQRAQVEFSRVGAAIEVR